MSICLLSDAVVEVGKSDVEHCASNICNHPDVLSSAGVMLRSPINKNGKPVVRRSMLTWFMMW